MNAVRLVQRAYKEHRKRVEEREERESKRRREYLNKEMEFKTYTPKEMIDVIRDKLRHTKEDPRKMIKAYNLIDNDEVDLKTLTSILHQDLKMGSLTKEFIKQLFEAIDKIRADKISYNTFLEVLYSDNAIELVGYPKKIEDLIQIVRKGANHHFESPNKFLDYCKPKKTGEVRFGDFYPFMRVFTRFNKDKILEVFNFLNTQNMGHINSV